MSDWKYAGYVALMVAIVWCPAICVAVLFGQAAPARLKAAPSARITPVELPEQPKVAEEPKPPAPADAAKKTVLQLAEPVPKAGREWTTIEIVLSVGILIFGLSCLVVESFLILRAAHHTTFDAASISRITGLTLIVTSSLVLVTAGYSTEQMSGVMGLLGTIAGYLLGSSGKVEKP